MYGGGARLEYAFARDASIYLDQSIGYLQDPNANNSDVYNQSAMSYTIIGIKINVTPYFQVGLQGMYNQTNLIDTSVGYNAITYSYQNTAQTSFGGMLSFAYLYNNDQLMSSLSNIGSGSSHSEAPNSLLAAFDNSYSLGMGWVNSTNSYKGGSAPSIGTSSNYIDFNVAHLFEK